jgi:hypothetical protein
VIQVPWIEDVVCQDTKALEAYHNRLVRLRMLVVETLDPEVYVGAAQEDNGLWKCGKYGDTLALDTPNKRHVFWERRPVRVIPIPGISTWASHSLPKITPSSMFFSARNVWIVPISPSSDTPKHVESRSLQAMAGSALQRFSY